MDTRTHEPASAAAASKSSKTGVTEEEVFGELHRAHERLERAVCDLIRRHGLSDVQLAALRAIHEAGEHGLHSGDIAATIPSRLPDITRLVDRLVKMRLVERLPCTEDRRVVWVRLTEKGKRLMREIGRPLKALHRNQLGHLSASERATLARLLRKARRGAKG